MLKPCICKRPAVILLGDEEGTFAISCWSDDCDQSPVIYQADNKRSRVAAIRTWNDRWKRSRSRG